jgi:formiminoglutamase
MATDTEVWTGRIDDLNDVDSYRIHQIIKQLNLNETNLKEIDSNKLNFCFIGYCCDEGIIRNLGKIGAKYGPDAIRKKFASLPASFGNDTQIYDGGNLYCENGNMEETQQQLALSVERILDNNMFPIVLGGSHDLAFGHYNGIYSYLNGTANVSPKIGIINIDAHFDLRPYDNQSSSGTMFTQIADNCTNENVSFNYLCLGIQSAGNTKSLFKKADSLGAKYIMADEFVESNYISIMAKIKSFIDSNDYIYLTLCSDVFNSASAPGVSALQPFGLNPNQVLPFIREILNSKKVISFDIAEVSPPLDHDKRTAKLAAIILYKIINEMSK